MIKENSQLSYEYTDLSDLGSKTYHIIFFPDRVFLSGGRLAQVLSKAEGDSVKDFCRNLAAAEFDQQAALCHMHREGITNKEKAYDAIRALKVSGFTWGVAWHVIKECDCAPTLLLAKIENTLPQLKGKLKVSDLSDSTEDLADSVFVMRRFCNDYLRNFL